MRTEERRHTTPECEISADLAKRLDVSNGASCRLRVGAKSARIRLTVNPDLGTASMAIPESVLDALSIRAGLQTNVRRAGADLRLGPVVGVFVNPRAAARAARGLAGFRLDELMKANREAGCILYVFSSEDVDFASRQALGAYYDCRRNEWRQRLFPLPDVLYDRGGGFLPAQRPLARYIRRQLRSLPGLKKLNGQHYFDKWDQYRRLKRHSPLCRHLPETRLYTGREALASMLRKHRCVYVKSALGSNGRDVMRIAAAEGGYAYGSCRTETKTGLCPDLASLDAVVRDFLGRHRAVIQAGIDLLTHRGSLVDLRVLVARDARGDWRIIDIPVRVARGDCAVTSTRSGSTVYRFREFFRTALLYDEDRLNDLRKRIGRVVRRAVQAIEEEYGVFGELGLDLGLDKEGKIWFIEANAKPGKDTIRLAGDPHALAKAFLFPLQYCRMLAGFADADGRADAVRIRKLRSRTAVPGKRPAFRPCPARKPSRANRDGEWPAGVPGNSPPPSGKIPVERVPLRRAAEVNPVRPDGGLAACHDRELPASAANRRRPGAGCAGRGGPIPGIAQCCHTGKSAAITRVVTGGKIGPARCASSYRKPSCPSAGVMRGENRSRHDRQTSTSFLTRGCQRVWRGIPVNQPSGCVLGRAVKSGIANSFTLPAHEYAKDAED